MALIRFEDISKAYVSNGREVEALSGVNLDVERDEFVSIIGPSGCGKSTLLRLLAGFSYPTSGAVYCGGKRVQSINPQVGFISQDNDLFPWMTLGENVEFPLTLRGMSAAESRKRARALIDLVGLSGFEDRYPHELSGGMQKRGSIIRTIIYEPSSVLMDEPFGPLDAQTRLLLQHELLNVWNARRMTVLFVTHDLVEAVALSDRVVVMTKRPGGIKAVVPVKLGRPRDVFEIHEHPGFREAHHEVWRLLRTEMTTGKRADGDR
jgi:NitT/TauT family transport system ATP-binding protein